MKNMERRIYAVCAETVDTPTRRGVVQIPGRMSAQFSHATSKMKMHRMLSLVEKEVNSGRDMTGPNGDLAPILETMEKIADEKITTINLSCRDSKELGHVMGLLHDARIKWHGFWDENPEVYGPGAVLTAIATYPVKPSQVEGILDYLPLWDPEKKK